MKRKHIILITLAAVFAAFSCGKTPEKPDPTKPDTPDVKAQITLQSAPTATLAADGGEVALSFSSTLPWTVTVDETVGWVRPSMDKGAAGDAALTLSVARNNSYNERTATVTVSCGSGDNVASAAVTITQKQHGALVLSPGQFVVSDEGEVITITILHSESIDYAISEDAASWIIPANTKALAESTLTFNVLPNESYDERQGTILFTSGDATDKVTVIQKQHGALILSQSTFNVSGEGEVIDITLKHSSEISYAISEAAAEWIVPVVTKGLVESTLHFEVLPNESDEVREGYITFSSESASEKVTVKQGVKGAFVIAQTEYIIAGEGETIQVKVSSTAPVSYAVAEDAASWIIPANTKAATENVFTFGIQPNETGEARTGTIAFSSEAGSGVVTVNQEAMTPPEPQGLVVEKTEYRVSYEGAVIDIKVTAPAEVDYAVSEEAAGWIVPTDGSLPGEGLYQFGILANESADSREGRITFTCGEESAEVKIIQKGNVPSEGTIVEVATAEDLIQFAIDYNNRVYFDVTDLVVNLTADLYFDDVSSAAMNATGGIGNKDAESTNYFHGIFNGDGHTIYDWNATVPLFAYTGSTGAISDFKIDGSCSFTFTHPEDTDFYCGPVVGYHKGVIDMVDVNASVSMAHTTGYIEYLTALGGLVGRSTTGSISNSSFGGSITVPGDFLTAKKLLIGGLLGYFSNAGSVSASSFAGTICNEARVQGDPNNDENKSNPHLIIGGIVGYNGGGGVVEDCGVYESPAEKMIAGAYNNTFGTIVNKTVEAMHSAQGAVVGENVNGSVVRCTNYATLLVTLFKDNNDNAMGRYLRAGGVVGMNRADGEVLSCTNEGPVIIRSNPRLHAVGGVVGWNAAEGLVSDAANLAPLSIGTSGVGSYSARIPNFGGVIGENYSSRVDGLRNTAELLISRTENSTGTEVRMGGVIGANYANIDGSFTNSGRLYFNTNLTNQALKYSIGGIVGYSEGGVSGATNSGYVFFNWSNNGAAASLVHLGGIVGYVGGSGGTISNCSNVGGEGNAGEVYLAVKSGSAGHTENFVGGIVGKAAADVTITGCSNSAYIHGGNATKVNGKTCYLGGIVAWLGGASSITGCENTGLLFNDQFNNTITKAGSTFEGGIAGFVQGKADSRITIDDVSNVVTGKGGRRGYTGGIVGYAEYADISNAINEGDYVGGSAYYIGGVAGWLANSTLTACTYGGSEIGSSQIQKGGGIVAQLDAGSVVNGCSSYLATVTVGSNPCVSGAIAGTSAEGSTISDCHYVAGGLDICSDTNFTDGGGNEADL